MKHSKRIQAFWSFVFAALWFNCYILLVSILASFNGLAFGFINLISAFCFAASVYLLGSGLKNLVK